MLGGDEPAATLRLPMLGTSEGRRLLAQKFERVVITGSPPRGEIGFGLATLIVPLVRARHVILVDDRTGATTARGTPSFLPAAVPRALYQLAASAAAVSAQRLATGPPTEKDEPKLGVDREPFGAHHRAPLEKATRLPDGSSAR